MANRNTKAKNDLLATDRAQQRKGNPDLRFKNPPRRNHQKDFSKYISFPGFRKPKREDSSPSSRVKIYKEQN